MVQPSRTFSGKDTNRQLVHGKRLDLTSNERHTNLSKGEEPFSIYQIGETFKVCSNRCWQCGEEYIRRHGGGFICGGKFLEGNLAKAIKTENSHSLWQSF